MRSPIFKRLAVVSLAAFLLLMGYYWTQRSAGPASPAARSPSDSVATTDTVVVAEDSSAVVDTVSTTAEPIRKKPSVTLTPIAPAPASAPEPDQPADRPATLERKSDPAEAAEKPTPPPCDQLVMRNGDLIDVKVLEVGVNEIRYRRCHREDGPEYVVSKSDVLSIRYANGDIDRFSWKTVRARSSEVV